LVPIALDHTPIVLCLDDYDPTWTNKHMVNVAAVARRRYVVYQIEIVRQASKESAH
jgi:hypothetical protein